MDGFTMTTETTLLTTCYSLLVALIGLQYSNATTAKAEPTVAPCCDCDPCLCGPVCECSVVKECLTTAGGNSTCKECLQVAYQSPCASDQRLPASVAVIPAYTTGNTWATAGAATEQRYGSAWSTAEQTGRDYRCGPGGCPSPVANYERQPTQPAIVRAVAKVFDRDGNCVNGQCTPPPRAVAPLSDGRVIPLPVVRDPRGVFVQQCAPVQQMRSYRGGPVRRLFSRLRCR